MATPYRLKRSSVNNKRPTLSDLEKGELALNFYNGHLFAEVDTSGVGIGTTIANLTPWREQFARNEIQYTGVVSATTYHGDQVIGTPNGGFKSGAFVIGSGNVTKDSINELNFILGKLVPDAPTTLAGLAVTLTSLNGGGGNGETVGRLCQGFTPADHTSTGIATAGQSYSRNTDSTITTLKIQQVGPGDSGTVKGFLNTVGVGTVGLTTAANNTTSDALEISNNIDASNSSRNPGITSEFYFIYDARIVGAASSNGFNEAYFTQGGNTSGKAYFYEDPSTVAAPVISFSTPAAPGSPTLSYSSFIPHYTQASGNAFTYTVTVTNASGDMYKQDKLLNSDGQTAGFVNPGHKDYDDFGSGTLPPAQNFGVGSGAQVAISQAPRDLHLTLTSNHFTRFDADTPYGQHLNQRPSYSTNINIMGTTARTNAVDEDNILISGTLGSGSGNASRVPSIAASDNPSQSGASYSWAGNANGTPAVFDAIVRGAVLRHDQTNYSTGYLPAGPNLSSGRSGSQYFQFQIIRSAVSEFNITITGSYAGCKICMPDNSAWVTGLSATNGWADMFQAYSGSGTPSNANPGCSDGGVMTGSSGTFKCVFGEQSSSNDSNNRILVRVKLTSGAASVTALSISAT